jgi:hypothetical protein
MRPDGDIIEVSTNQRPSILTGHRPMIDSKIDVPKSSQLPLSVVIKTTWAEPSQYEENPTSIIKAIIFQNTFLTYVEKKGYDRRCDNMGFTSLPKQL